jgi:GNAT superfamily N-acetyltransferase
MKKITIQKASPYELKSILKIEQAAWPEGDGMVADQEKFIIRLRQELINIALIDGEPAGAITFQKPGWISSEIIQAIHNDFLQSGDLLNWYELSEKYNLPKDWYQATDDGYLNGTHSIESNCGFLVGVGVDPKFQGQGIVNKLIAYTLQDLKSQGINHIIGYGRLPQLSQQYDSPSISEAEQHLLTQKPGTNFSRDYGARFHQFNGAESVSVIPNVMDDPESCDYGFLALYNI